MLRESRSRSRGSFSPWLVSLLLIGLYGWLSPLVAAARRSHVPSPSVTDERGARDIVLPLSSHGELCVQGTSLAGLQRVAIVNHRVVAQGDTVICDDRHYFVKEIGAEQVVLRRVN